MSHVGHPRSYRAADDPIPALPRTRQRFSPDASGSATTARSSRSPRARRPGPPGSAGAQVIDVGSSLVLPGLIDLHNHLAYNTLPLWTEPAQTDTISASQLLDKSRQLRGEHHLARVRADHCVPAGAAGLCRGQGDRRWHDIDPGISAQESTARWMAGPQYRGRDLRFARCQSDLRVGAHRKAGRARRACQQDASRLCFHLPLLRGPAWHASSRASSQTPRQPVASSRDSLQCTPMPLILRPSHTGRHPAPSPGRRSPTCGSTVRPPMCPPRGPNRSTSASDPIGHRRGPRTCSAN